MRALIPAVLLFGACAAPWRDDCDALRAELDGIGAIHRAVPIGPSTDETLDRALAQSVDPDTLVALARRRNPEIREAAARAAAMLEEVARAGALDDPMLKLRHERMAESFDRNAELALALEQKLPAFGALGLRAEGAFRDAQAMALMMRERERDVIARVKKAWVEYASMTRHLEIHREHVAILEELEKISGAKFRTGAVSQQDVLKPQVELVTLLNELILDEQKILSAKAAINALLDRPADAPLGAPAELAAPGEALDAAALQARAQAERPEVRAAELRAKGTAARLAAAEREAAWPELSVEVEAMQRPGEEDSWAGMLAVSLPWFTGKRSAEARMLRESLRADEIAAGAARTRAQWEVREAHLRVEAARKSAALFKGELVPKSRQSVEVSRASYEKDKATFLDLLDAERSLRDVKLDHTRALADYASALADLERAVGADLRRKP
jgi:outer membrane protein TolC